MNPTPLAVAPPRASLLAPETAARRSPGLFVEAASEIVRVRTRAVVIAIAIAAALATAGCKSPVECTSEVTAGNGTFKGAAKGKPDDASIRRRAVKDACEQMCIRTKSVSLDVCSSRCVVDAEAGKNGAVTKCSNER